MKTLFLHIGTQKTGTTSIQRVLADRRQDLLSLGFEYPEVEPDDANKVSHYNAFRGFFSKRPDQIEATKRFCARVSKSENTLILSAECLSVWPVRRPGQKLFEYWSAKKQIVRSICEAFPNHAGRIVVFHRSRSDFMESLYEQHLHVTGKTDAPPIYEEFLRKHAHMLDYDAEVATWRSAFSQVDVINYDAIESSVAAFNAIVGLPPFPDVRENVTASRAGRNHPASRPTTDRAADRS